jgi:hypothetical protein
MEDRLRQKSRIVEIVVEIPPFHWAAESLIVVELGQFGVEQRLQCGGFGVVSEDLVLVVDKLFGLWRIRSL